MSISLLIILSCLLLSAFFSGMEIAYVSANKIHIELEKKQKGLLAKILGLLTARPSKFITAMLVGNNIALVIYGFYMGELTLSWIHSFYPTSSAIINSLLTDFKLLFQTLISTIIILVTAEFLPKVLFQIYANLLLKIFAAPAYFFYLLFWPVSELILRFSNGVLKIFFKTDGDEVQKVFTKVELGDYISEQIDEAKNEEEIDSEIQIFRNALDFSEVKAREVMIPRTEIAALDVYETPEKLTQLFVDTGYSKIVIYKDTIDDIIGYAHSFELFKKPKSIKSLLLPIEWVPETMKVKDVLNLLIRKRKSMAVVLDEYGGTSGLMTLEDIVEELFGEIEDEHDQIELLEEQINEAEFKLSARLEVDYLNEEYKIGLPESENYETLGGCIMNYTQEIPEKNSQVNFESFEITVLEVSRTKIETVKLKILP